MHCAAKTKILNLYQTAPPARFGVLTDTAIPVPDQFLFCSSFGCISSYFCALYVPEPTVAPTPSTLSCMPPAQLCVCLFRLKQASLFFS